MKVYIRKEDGKITGVFNVKQKGLIEADNNDLEVKEFLDSIKMIKEN